MSHDLNLFSHKMNVRIDDLNFGNHLCHTKFISFMHNTRALFLKKHGLSELNCFGYGLIMLNLNITYLSQCLYNDLLEISLKMDKLEKVTFSLAYSIHNHTADKQAAKAVTVMGFLNEDKVKLRRVPDEFIKLFREMSE